MQLRRGWSGRSGGQRFTAADRLYECTRSPRETFTSGHHRILRSPHATRSDHHHHDHPGPAAHGHRDPKQIHLLGAHGDGLCVGLDQRDGIDIINYASELRSLRTIEILH